jgi:hypothetical protein
MAPNFRHFLFLILADSEKEMLCCQNDVIMIFVLSLHAGFCLCLMVIMAILLQEPSDYLIRDRSTSRSCGRALNVQAYIAVS